VWIGEDKGEGRVGFGGGGVDDGHVNAYCKMKSLAILRVKNIAERFASNF
jgi:hypothetical protein